MANKQTEEKITALYKRLSRDDDLTDNSSSILNQKRYFESYAAQQDYSSIVHYTYYGLSGANLTVTHGSALQRIFEAGKVVQLMCYDLSRISRN